MDATVGSCWENSLASARHTDWSPCADSVIRCALVIVVRVECWVKNLNKWQNAWKINELLILLSNEPRDFRELSSRLYRNIHLWLEVDNWLVGNCSKGFLYCSFVCMWDDHWMKILRWHLDTDWPKQELQGNSKLSRNLQIKELSVTSLNKETSPKKKSPFISLFIVPNTLADNEIVQNWTSFYISQQIFDKKERKKENMFQEFYYNCLTDNSNTR